MARPKRPRENQYCSRLTVARVISKGDIRPNLTPPAGKVFPILEESCTKEMLWDKECGILMEFASVRDKKTSKKTDLASENLDALFQEAMRKGEENALKTHAWFLSNPGGLLKETVYALRDAKIIWSVCDDWAEHEGRIFMSQMNRSLGVANVMTTAKQILNLRLGDRIVKESAFWLDFNRNRYTHEPSGESFSALMASYIQANEAVHRPLTRTQLKEVKAQISNGGDFFGLDSMSREWFRYMLSQLLGSTRIV